MKNVTSPPPARGLLLLLLTLLFSGHARAQERPMKVVYDEKNQPSYIEREIIVRFNPAVVRFINIDDPAFQAGHLNDFINDSTAERISQALGYGAEQVDAFKMFGAMTSADTLSIDRLGDTIRLDDHWASFVLQLPMGVHEQDAINNLNALFPLVRYAHRNWVFALDIPNPNHCPTGEPNDSEYLINQASLHATAAYPDGHINVQPAWLLQNGRNSIRVGVVDSGINATHPDLNNGSIFGRIVTSGYDFRNNLPRYYIQDKVGHGTACAGIIGARRNNSSGIAGIAGGDGNQDGVQLIDLKIVDLSGFAPLSTIASALVEGSVQAPASSGYGYALHIMNNSWGGYPAQVTELRNAIRTCYRNKVVLVCAKGNDNLNNANYPSSFPDDWVLSVGASNESGNKASFSNYGQNVDLVAPGVSNLIMTTQSQQKIDPMTGQSGVTGLYQRFDGTSAAAPHVSGVAALLLSYLNSTTSRQNNLAPEDVEQLLQRTARDKGIINAAAPYDDQTGWGLLDASAALSASRPGDFRLVHDRLTTSTSVVANNVSVQLLSAYVSGTTALAAGNYIADRYRVTGTFSPRASLVPSNEQIVGVWARNSSTNLWSGANPLEGEAGVQVVSWNQNTVVAEGYTYFIKYNLAGQAVNRWAPYDPTTTSQGIMDVTYYTHDPNYFWPVLCRPAGNTAVAPAPSASPNPAAAEVTVDYTMPDDTHDVQLTVMNIGGQAVYQQSLGAQTAGPRKVTIDLHNLVSGFYMYRLVSDTGVQTGKFIKQ